MNIMILGVGNILLKDEGVGVRVVQELEKNYSFPSGIHLVDGGTSGPHLLNLMCEAQDIIVIDAVQGGERPGTLYKFDLEQMTFDSPCTLSIHQRGVLEALNEAKLLGKEPRVTFIGIEPHDISSWGMELSPGIKAKIPALIAEVLQELELRGVPNSSIVRKMYS